MARSKKQLKKSMKVAKQALMLKVDIGEIEYEFEADMFDLDVRNISILSEQSSKVPGYVAFIVEAHGEAERVLSREELRMELWLASRLVKHFSGKEFKSEKDKMNNLISSFPKEYTEGMEKVWEVKKLVRILEAYKKGIDAKLQLAQTLSANIRVERDAYTRDMDKKSKGSFAD